MYTVLARSNKQGKKYTCGTESLGKVSPPSSNVSSSIPLKAVKVKQQWRGDKCHHHEVGSRESGRLKHLSPPYDLYGLLAAYVNRKTLCTRESEVGRSMYSASTAKSHYDQDMADLIGKDWTTVKGVLAQLTKCKVLQ